MVQATLSADKAVATSPGDAWEECRFLTCSVLPVRMACNLRCPFCFSKSSVSTLRTDRVDWSRMPVERYYEFAVRRGASRLVITGGGEPLLRGDDVVSLVERGRAYFREIACFTNGALLTRSLADRLHEAGLSYVCWSRHHHDDDTCRRLMGDEAPGLAEFVAAAGPLTIRATCVMSRGFIDSTEAVNDYIARLVPFGIREFTFKHTYVAYETSVFGASVENDWARRHKIEFDPFADRGVIVSKLPWGPAIRRIALPPSSVQVCYYHEPTPAWEQEHCLCRSTNLLSDGSVYASLEDHRSRLFQLMPC